MNFLKSNNLAVLLGGALIVLAGIMTYVLIDYFIHMNHMRVVMSESQNAVLKVRYFSEMMEFARTHTRLTSQILDTEDVFKKDELNQQLEVYAGKFAEVYQMLRQLPLDEHEKTHLEMQRSIVSVILPAQRKVVSLSIYGEPSDLRAAEELFYSVVMTGQNDLINLFQGLVAYHQENTEALISDTDQLLELSLQNQKLYAFVILMVTLLISIFVVHRTRKIQNLLNHEREILENTIESRTAQLVKTRDEAEQANLTKSNFLATMSHELRTPLTSIKGSLGLLQSLITNDLTDEKKELFDITLRNSDAMLLLINELLDYEKIISGTMIIETSRHDIGALTARVVKDNQSYASERSVSFDYSGPVISLFANVQQFRFEQVLRNLLSNAAKFSDPGSDVEISVKSDDGMVIVSVKDYGLGMPEEFKQKVFEPFTQADSSSTRNHAGTGLGLSISKSLTDAMGGKLYFETEVGVGTTFFVSFPISE